MSTTLKFRLDELKSQLGLLPEAKEPPPTMLQVLGRSHQEKDWQRLLFHFLSPDEPHGLEHALLEQFLVALSERNDLDYTFSNFDLMDVRIKQEVSTNRGRPDAVLWSAEEWFICWELKIGATEGKGQTQAYVDVESFQDIDLAKDDVPTDGHFYVYLAPLDAEPPEADEFVPISWEWIASELQSFLVESHGEYPARTTAQLNDFIGTIRSELTMTDYQENQQDKAKLYLDYYDEISEVQDAFESQWENFTNNWGTQLAQSLDMTEIVEDSDVLKKYVALELEMQDGNRQRWIFRQGMSDWGGVLKDGWWKRTDDLSNIYVRPDDDNLAGVSFYHRLKHNRDLAVEDKTLEIQFWHSASNSDQFVKIFNRNLADREEEMKKALPSAAELPNITNTKGKLFTAKYNIRTENYDDFFQAYTASLKGAFLDLAVENETLVTLIDEVYEQSIDSVRRK